MKIRLQITLPMYLLRQGEEFAAKNKLGDAASNAINWRLAQGQPLEAPPLNRRMTNGLCRAARVSPLPFKSEWTDKLQEGTKSYQWEIDEKLLGEALKRFKVEAGELAYRALLEVNGG